MENKILNTFAMAQKAGKLTSGEELCEKVLRSGEALLVLVCEDASDNTKAKFGQKTFYYKVPFYCRFTKDELNDAIGKQNRATVAVTDEGFASKLFELLGEPSENISRQNNI